MTTVREATLEDAEGIHQISSYLGYTPGSTEASKKRLEQILDSNTDMVWICEDGASIVGWIHVFLALRLASPEFAEIGGLVVDQSHQRSGIGTRLAGSAIQWAKQKKLPLRVRCNAERQAANQFYKSLGFKLQKTQAVYDQTF